jgi:hypothetical protein
LVVDFALAAPFVPPLLVSLLIACLLLARSLALEFSLRFDCEPHSAGTNNSGDEEDIQPIKEELSTKPSPLPTVNEKAVNNNGTS